MIAFQHIKSGEFLAGAPNFPWLHCPSNVALLADAYPWHESDEAFVRGSHAFLVDYRTVTFSTRIDHPSNDLSNLTREQLAERYPIAR